MWKKQNVCIFFMSIVLKSMKSHNCCSSNMLPFKEGTWFFLMSCLSPTGSWSWLIQEWSLSCRLEEWKGQVLHAAQSLFLLNEVYTQLFRAKRSCSATASELCFGSDGLLIFPWPWKSHLAGWQRWWQSQDSGSKRQIHELKWSLSSVCDAHTGSGLQSLHPAADHAMGLQGQCYRAPVDVLKATSPWLSVLSKDAMGAPKTMSGLQDFLWGEGWILPDEITEASFWRVSCGHSWQWFTQNHTAAAWRDGERSRTSTWEQDPWGNTSVALCEPWYLTSCLDTASRNMFLKVIGDVSGRGWRKRGYPRPLVQGQREMEDIPLPAFVGLFPWKSCGYLTKTHVSVAKEREVHQAVSANLNLLLALW